MNKLEEYLSLNTLTPETPWGDISPDLADHIRERVKANGGDAVRTVRELLDSSTKDLERIQALVKGTLPELAPVKGSARNPFKPPVGPGALPI